MCNYRTLTRMTGPALVARPLQVVVKQPRTAHAESKNGSGQEPNPSKPANPVQCRRGNTYGLPLPRTPGRSLFGEAVSRLHAPASIKRRGRWVDYRPSLSSVPVRPPLRLFVFVVLQPGAAILLRFAASYIQRLLKLQDARRFLRCSLPFGLRCSAGRTASCPATGS